MAGEVIFWDYGMEYRKEMHRWERWYHFQKQKDCGHRKCWHYATLMGSIRMEFREIQMWDMGVKGNRTNGELYQSYGTQNQRSIGTVTDRHSNKSV